MFKRKKNEEKKLINLTLNLNGLFEKRRKKKKIKFLMEKEENNSKRSLIHYIIRIMKILNIIADKMVLERLFLF